MRRCCVSRQNGLQLTRLYSTFATGDPISNRRASDSMRRPMPAHAQPASAKPPSSHSTHISSTSACHSDSLYTRRATRRRRCTQLIIRKLLHAPARRTPPRPRRARGNSTRSTSSRHCSGAMVLIPTVKWAQRSSVVYLTIDVQDSKDPQLHLTNTDDGNGHLTYKSVASGGEEDQLYELDLVLFGAVNKDASKISVSPRSVFLVIEKAAAETWPRLTKDSGRHLSHIKVDWDKWVDSDDEGDDSFNPDALGDFTNLGGGMGGMPGMGGMGGMDLSAMLGGMGGDMGGMGGMGAMGGMGDMDFSAAPPADVGAGGGADSDDEDLPELQA